MSEGLAPAITRAASRQTYYTIRFLVDPDRREDAYRAYAYFRWMDDVLDAELPSDGAWSDANRLERRLFLDRQQDLLERCLEGEVPKDATDHEAMLVELTRQVGPAAKGLEAYLRHMMLVMAFDVERRGRLVLESELDDYTRWLAIAVTESMHHFIGNGAATPPDETRYRAVSGAHILHMLRDTFTDVRAGYFNIPREVLERHSIGPEDVDSDAYRAWVRLRVQQARSHFEAGRAHFARIKSRRHRIAGLAYMARFEWLIDVLEREQFRLRPRYDERRRLASGLRLSWRLTSRIIGSRALSTHPLPIAAQRDGRQ